MASVAGLNKSFFAGIVTCLMPELPEVEIQVRRLSRRLRGSRIISTEMPDSKIDLPRAVAGQGIRRVWRRGKFIVFDLSSGAHLLAHLRMTGWFEFVRPARYRLAIRTNKGTVYFEDRRRFGQVKLVSAAGLGQVLNKLGREPLRRGFSLAAVAKTSRAIKVALLDQRLVAGLGNIYSSESLWRARIHPLQAANRLGPGDLKRLERSIVVTLRRAISLGDGIFSADNAFAVYERAGQPCRRCRTPVRRLVQAQRSTYFCPKCQHP